jgi:hypothetical protein
MALEVVSFYRSSLPLPARYSLLSASTLGTLVQALWQLGASAHCQ